MELATPLIDIELNWQIIINYTQFNATYEH